MPPAPEETISQLKSEIALLTNALAREKQVNELNSRFISLASHEFRVPLNTIQSSAYLISQYTREDDKNKRKKHLERIKSCVALLTDILTNFQYVGKIEDNTISPQISYHNIKSLTKGIFEELETHLKKGQFISYKHEGIEEVLTDNMLYRYILYNLLSNAIKFSPENAEVVISTRVKEGIYTISVKDKGIGISPEDQELLFQRFFRGKNVANIKGTGLGLYIISKYVELLNGKIECRSLLGEGTEFIVHFKPTILL